MIYTEFKNGRCRSKSNDEIINEQKLMIEILENFFDDISHRTIKVIGKEKVLYKANPFSPFIAIQINDKDKTIKFVYEGKIQPLPIIYYPDDVRSSFKINGADQNFEEAINMILDTSSVLYDQFMKQIRDEQAIYESLLNSINKS